MIRDVIRQEFSPRQRLLLPVAGVAIAVVFFVAAALPGILG